MGAKLQFDFSASVWQHASSGGWYFVSLPALLADEIRNALRSEEEGWGRLPAKARIGNSEWETAIWFDTKRKTYLLPLKAAIRKKERIRSGELIRVSVWL